MCLSTVMNQDKKTLCENVMLVKTKENGELIFTNILGISTSIFGSIEKINLMDNTILVHQIPEVPAN